MPTHPYGQQNRNLDMEKFAKIMGWKPDPSSTTGLFGLSSHTVDNTHTHTHTHTHNLKFISRVLKMSYWPTRAPTHAVTSLVLLTESDMLYCARHALLGAMCMHASLVLCGVVGPSNSFDWTGFKVVQSSGFTKPLLAVQSANGFLGCAYFSIDTINVRLGS